MPRAQSQRIYPLVDMHPAVAVVRCAPGDREAFDHLVARWQREWRYALPEGFTIDAPVWRWYRMNPVPPGGEYRWELAESDGPGHGNWQGALVNVVRVKEGEV